ncbi:MAG: cyclohexanone monooxygenase [Subtercola sp.]|nr:cyclohexanone monooxygenase [Subtercola sp.]
MTQTDDVETAVTRYDAIIIGAGFSGMYMLHKLRDELGMTVRLFERGDGVGGTWYWNRYPGARCDVPSMFYSYSFDDDLEQEWQWTERYAAQPEILRYAEHVADRFDLTKNIEFGRLVTAADFDDASATWTITTDEGTKESARYLIAASGPLSAAQVPRFEGLDDFAGDWYHTGDWPEEQVDFTGKRVGIIGTGSSGVQSIPVIAETAEHVIVFQRTATFSVPAQNYSLTAEERDAIKKDYKAIRASGRVGSGSGTPMPAPKAFANELSPAELQHELDAKWEWGGPAFLRAFKDTMTDRKANRLTADYVRAKIREIVKDPDTAELLMPPDYPIGAKRLPADTGYFETFNRDNVRLVSVRGTPIERITTNGIVVGDEEYKLDAIVFATGYDAVTGALNNIRIRNSAGELLKDKWMNGPRAYLGVMSAGFPNLFMVVGPSSPSITTNVLVSIEQHVEWISEYIAFLREHGIETTEADLTAEDEWVEHVSELADGTLFPEADSWYMGANIPGKPRVFLAYVAGVGTYKERCDAVAAAGYTGFIHDGEPAHSLEDVVFSE